MKKPKQLILLTILTCLSVLPFYGASSQNENLIESRDTLSGFFPLSENPQNENRLFAYLSDLFSREGIAYEYQSLENIESAHSFSFNMIVTLPGEKEEVLILIQPIKGNRNSFANIAVLVELIRKYSLEKPPLTLIFLITGADLPGEDPLGSLDFLERYSYENQSALIYYRPDISENTIEIKGDVPGYTAPSWLMEKVGSAASENGVNINYNTSSMLLNKTGVPDRDPPISYFLSEGIPSVAISTAVSGDSNLPVTSRNLNNQFFMLSNLIGGLSAGIPLKWDNNYLIFNYSENEFILIQEQSIVLVFLILFALSVLFPLFQERRIHLNYKRFRHQLWTVPVIMYLTFQFSMLATLIIEELLVYRNYPELAAQKPLVFFLFKATLILFFSRFMLNLLKGLPFPKNPTFYSYMAFIFAFINVCVSVLINIIFSIFFLWILLMSILFNISRNKVRKHIFFYLSLAPVILLALAVFTGSSTDLFNFILTSRVRGNVFLTFASLPFTSMITSLSFYHHHYEKSRREVRSALGILWWASAALFLSYHIMHLEPYSDRAPQRVILSDIQYLDSGMREILISSKSAIGDGELIFNDNSIPLINGGTEIKIQGEIQEDLLETAVETDTFLDRRSVTLTVSSFQEPAGIRLHVISEDPIVFYDCPFPYEVAPDEKSAEIFIGEFPPVPLRIPMIFSKSSKPDFILDVIFNDTPYSLLLKKDFMQIQTEMTLRKSILFSSLTDVQ